MDSIGVKCEEFLDVATGFGVEIVKADLEKRFHLHVITSKYSYD